MFNMPEVPKANRTYGYPDDDNGARVTGRLRRITWPLGAFLLGFLLLQPRIENGLASMVLGGSVGLLWAAIALVIAIFLMKNRGPTGTYLPGSGERPGLDALFFLSVAAALGMKLAGYRGLLPFALGVIPVAIIMYGGRALLNRTVPLSRGEMIAKLQEVADDPDSTESVREGALKRLRAFERLNG